jgi:hypothetical protein
MVFDGGVGLKPLRVATRLAALCLALAGLMLPLGADARQRGRRVPVRPVVVELFTAQGCASCPQANQMLGEIAARKGVIALTYSVDYWDYLGWRDTFAMPEFTARQRAYVGRLKLKEIYTPEAVVGGRHEAPAVDQDKLEAIIEAEAKSRAAAPAIGFARHGRTVTVGTGPVPRGGAEVWLVSYDPMRRDVRVKAGENAGKTVTHVNVVRGLVRLGAWTGRARSFDIPDDPIAPGLQMVAILQGKGGGPILAAAHN